MSGVLTLARRTHGPCIPLPKGPMEIIKYAALNIRVGSCWKRPVFVTAVVNDPPPVYAVDEMHIHIATSCQRFCIFLSVHSMVVGEIRQWK